MKRLLLMLSIIFLSACSTIPKNLQVSDEVSLTEFAQVRAFSEENIGQMARWGGVIAAVQNNVDSTLIEVVNFDLGASSRPKPSDNTQGRFRLYFNEFLDPMIYKPGKSITALGKVASSEPGKIGEHDYLYPVLNAASVHLWKDISRVDVRIMQEPAWFYPSYWHYPIQYSNVRPVIIHQTNQQTKSNSTKNNSSNK